MQRDHINPRYPGDDRLGDRHVLSCQLELEFHPYGSQHITGIYPSGGTYFFYLRAPSRRLTRISALASGLFVLLLAILNLIQFFTGVNMGIEAVSYTHLRAHETRHDLVCRLLLEK